MKCPAGMGKTLTAVVFFLVFQPLFHMQAQAAIPQHEREALIALYNSTNGAGWTNNTGWLGAPGTECGWFGVTCDPTETAVIYISLGSNQLSGSIPVELGNLSSLEWLYLHSNQLSGSIPAELGNKPRRYGRDGDLKADQSGGSADRSDEEPGDQGEREARDHGPGFLCRSRRSA